MCLAANGNSLAVPVAPFTLIANHPVLGTTVASPAAAGQFADGASVTQQDVVFTNTGIARGTVTLNGTPVNGANVSAQGKFGQTSFNLTTTSAAPNGSFVFPVTPAVQVTFAATVSLPAGGTRTVSTVATFGAGTVADTPLAVDTIAPVVAITAPASTATIDPRAPLPVTVSVADQGGVTQITLQATGVTTFSETRPVAPPATAGSQTFTVPFATLPVSGGTLTLTATARDGQTTRRAPRRSR